MLFDIIICKLLFISNLSIQLCILSHLLPSVNTIFIYLDVNKKSEGRLLGGCTGAHWEIQTNTNGIDHSKITLCRKVQRLNSLWSNPQNEISRCHRSNPCRSAFLRQPRKEKRGAYPYDCGRSVGFAQHRSPNSSMLHPFLIMWMSDRCFFIRFDEHWVGKSFVF